LTDPLAIDHWFKPKDAHRSTVGREQTEYETDRGCLSCSVMTEQTNNLAGSDLETDPGKRHGLTEPPLQPVDHDDRCVGCHWIDTPKLQRATSSLLIDLLEISLDE
jgi:hypothetical protein